MDLREEEVDLLAEQWRVFRKHLPVGAYLPVGQLDGDCRECGGSWPCPPVLTALLPLIVRLQAEAWDEGYGAGQRTDKGAETQAPNPYRADQIGSTDG